MTEEQAYYKGFEDGLRAFAWWSDGEEFVGTCGWTLRRALQEITELSTYLPPKEIHTANASAGKVKP